MVRFLLSSSATELRCTSDVVISIPGLLEKALLSVCLSATNSKEGREGAAPATGPGGGGGGGVLTWKVVVS